MLRLSLTVEALHALRCGHGRLREGCHSDYLSHVVPGKFKGSHASADRGRALVAELAFDFCGLADVAPHLRSWEVSERSHHGSFSMDPGYHCCSSHGVSLEEKMSRYYRPRDAPRIQEDAWKTACGQLRSLYDVGRFGKLVLTSLIWAATRGFLGKRTGLGFPFMSSHRRYWFPVYKISEAIENSGFDPVWVRRLKSVLGSRKAAKAPGHHANVRGIHQMPRAFNNGGKRWQGPLQEALLRAFPFAAWRGRDSVNSAMTRLFKNYPTHLKMCLDFKQFDVSVPNRAIDAAFDTIAGWFELEAGPQIRFSQEVVKRIGMLAPDHHYHGDEKSGGIPSGDVSTNLIDSLINLLVMFYVAAVYKCHVLFIQVQGDDVVVVFSDQTLTIEAIAGTLSHDLGMTISMDKSYCEVRHVHFLQNVHSMDHAVSGLNVGVRPFMHALNPAMSHTDVDVDGWRREDETVRLVQQLNDCDTHPQFERIGEWALHVDGCLRDILVRLCDDDDQLLPESLRRVVKKRRSSGGFNSEWSVTPDTFRSSPLVRVLRKRLRV